MATVFDDPGSVAVAPRRAWHRLRLIRQLPAIPLLIVVVLAFVIEDHMRRNLSIHRLYIDNSCTFCFKPRFIEKDDGTLELLSNHLEDDEVLVKMNTESP